MKNKPIVRGAIYGAVFGALVLSAAYFMLLACFKYVLVAATDAPLYCASGIYGAMQALTFPIPVLTSDLANAAYYAPLTILFYAVIGAVIALFRNK